MTIFNALPIILQNGTLADANQVMSDFNKIIGDGNANAAANGANADITSLSALTSPIPIAGGSSTHFLGPTSTGTAAAQVVTPTTPSNWSLTTGFMISFNPGFSSTGATTLNVGGTGALAIRKPTPSGPVALQPNDMVSGQNATVVYDGTAYLLIDASITPAFGARTSLASAATTDLGTIQSNNVLVTGTTTITSFGSSANVANPWFFVVFGGALTITYNATSMIIPGNASLVTASGDQALVEYLGSGNWKVAIYQKQDGTPIVSPAGTANVLVGIQVFTANGTYTPNAAATRAFAIVTGSGAGGGNSSGSSATGGGGGGAGGTTIAYLSSLSTLGVTIGAAPAAATNGNASSLGTITANGGTAGVSASTINTGQGGNGATASGTGTIGIAGGDGLPGYGIASNTPYGGAGGASFWGGGAKGNLGAQGNAGNVYGSGGSGGTGTTGTGGAGAQGVIVVFEFK